MTNDPDTAGVEALIDENRLLHRIIEVTTADLQLDMIVRLVADLVVETTEADVCFLHLVDKARSRLVLVGATPPFDRLAGTIELELGEGIAGWVAAHGEPAVLFDDKFTDPRYKYIPELRGEDYTTLVSVPLSEGGGHVIGVLNVHSKRPRQYTEADVALLMRVARLVARSVENARLHQQLAAREATLERFAASTVEAQEQERRRVAGDIHDGISQRLVSLWYRLSAASQTDSDAVRAEELERAKELTAAALDDARVAVSGLRPSTLDDLGLGPTLISLARTLPIDSIRLDVASTRLAPHVETALYRVAQEALQNVCKHAQATMVEVTLRAVDGLVVLSVADDGVGLPSPPAADATSYGIEGMAERAELIGGRFTVTSRPQGGTTVTVSVPVAGSGSHLRDGPAKTTAGETTGAVAEAWLPR